MTQIFYGKLFPHVPQSPRPQVASLCLRLLPTLVLLLFASSVCRAETVRVGLVRHLRGVSEIAASSSSGFELDDPASPDPVVPLKPGDTVTLKASENGVAVVKPDGTTVTAGEGLEIKTAEPEDIIKIDSPNRTGGSYRGVIEVLSHGRALQLVNRVDLEDYLLGVVASEMPSQFCPEALKAQAVAARTYALAVRGKHKKDGYDLCDDNNCQVYLGAGAEKPAATQAVKDTAGIILTYQGKPIDARFSSDCGGRTREGGEPYLKSVSDRPDANSSEFCSGNARHNWTVKLTRGELESALSKTSIGPVSHVKSLNIKDTDDSGRAAALEVIDDNGGHTVCTDDLRRALGTAVLRSGIFTITKREDGSFVFQGKGWGHGVGMCQQGANGMAKAPYSFTYDKILEHYYTGVKITRLTDTVARNLP